jgi:hypothetical protein
MDMPPDLREQRASKWVSESSVATPEGCVASHYGRSSRVRAELLLAAWAQPIISLKKGDANQCAPNR